jgi:hypothetical protein
VGLNREVVWRAVTGTGCPSLKTLRTLQHGLRLPLENVTRACEAAQALEQQRLGVERAALEVELRSAY